ncbi:MAG: tetraacyldisaccharide 4'-kinase, partial [Candidatus Omnitrophica bacterium]|nr:tetraacyldisaccharide 4'-kinase [Candidatus Omnitrophota bacterium]
EANMLRKALKGIEVVVGARRFLNAQKYLRHYDADVFILDDGYQHYQLARDLDILAVDTTNPFGNGRLIPRGILREPLESLKRAQIFILTKTDIGFQNLAKVKETIKQLNTNAPIIETIHKPKELVGLKDGDKKPINFLQGKEVGVFCSIADPYSFEKTLSRLGAKVKQSRYFLDHHYYLPREIKNIIDQCRSKKINLLITTEKDAAKLEELMVEISWEGLEIYYLKIGIEVLNGKEKLFERINNLQFR